MAQCWSSGLEKRSPGLLPRDDLRLIERLGEADWNEVSVAVVSAE